MKQLIVKRTPAKLEVITAPDEIGITLAIIQGTTPTEMTIGSDTVYIGTDPEFEYQITGWDAEAKCLIARKVV